MLKLVIPALAAAGWVAAVALPTAASAAPAGFAPVALPDTAVEESRYMRRRPMMRRSMYRRRGMGRMAAPSQAGNARNPSAPVSQQQQGQTTGGPRY